MSESNEVYSFHFKVINTERIFNFQFNTETTVKNFINILSQHMYQIEPNYDIEIIECSNFNINSENIKQHPKINYHNDYTLRDIYHNKWRQIIFYIRFITSHQN